MLCRPEKWYEVIIKEIKGLNEKIYRCKNNIIRYYIEAYDIDAKNITINKLKT